MEQLIAQIKEKHPEYADHVESYLPHPDEEAPLYSDYDNVIILDDSSFLDKKIISKQYSGPGILQAYATWCPHCKSKVSCINVLADLLKDTEYSVYVIDADQNKIAARVLGVDMFPTFYTVDNKGVVGKEVPMTNGMKDLIKALCKQDGSLCKLVGKYGC